MACRVNCPLALIHDCIEIPGDKFAIQRIPKRKEALLVKVNAPEFAWGIEARNSISLVGVFTYHILILAGPFIFWGWWLRYHPGDSQNGSVPITIVTVLLSLFWASAGILNILRDPE